MGIEGVVSTCELWFTATNDLLGCPHFEVIAPVVYHRYPDLWRRYRAPIAGRVEFFKSDHEQGFLDRFDACGALPEPSPEEFAAAIGKAAVVKSRINGAAAAPLPEQIEQTETAENAA